MYLGLALFVGVVIGIPLGIVVAARLRQIPSLQPPRTVDPMALVSDQLIAAVDVLRAAGVIVGPHDEVLHSNPAARSLGVVRGSRIAIIEILDVVRECRARGRGTSTKVHVKEELGKPARDFGVRVVDFDGGVEFMIADDLSAARRVEEVRRDFVANVSHELKTPVGAIQILAEAMEHAADDPEAVSHFSHKLTQETARLSELIQQIIELSRLQSHDPLVKPQVVSIDEVIAEACDSASQLAADRQVNLTVTGHSGLEVMGDAEQLVSAVSNLIVNAITYSDPRARVSVLTRQVTDAEDRFVEICVSDNGIGMKSEELERIFERFYRVDDHRNRNAGGTGLGLSIVKHIVGAHGGSVQVWSKVGQGSTFTLRLPASDDTESETFGNPAHSLTSGLASDTLGAGAT